ncbi:MULTISPECIES: hypothetical protein [Paenibacillus]|uniref:hypothetical protein n=1 Tax=Paenibacillus TaxID=44249 RepID=UPI00188B34A1|nr:MULTISPECIES: hypothetical protein [Paenibacillus]MBX4146478.1 hypothetical protein [Paenibacillus lautus]
MMETITVTEFPVLNPDHRRALLPINIAIFPKEGKWQYRFNNIKVGIDGQYALMMCNMS